MGLIMQTLKFNFIHLYSVINNSHWNQRSLQSSRPGPTETKTLVWECSSSVERGKGDEVGCVRIKEEREMK